MSSPLLRRVGLLETAYQAHLDARLEALSDAALCDLVGPRWAEYEVRLTPDELLAMARGEHATTQQILRQYRAWLAEQERTS